MEHKEEHQKVLREAGEDYLETILDLEDENHNVRSIDVANTLGVSRPSVNKAIGVLKELGYVEQQPYGSIRLTESGRQQAAEVTRRHRILRFFLIEVLGVEREIANEDACRMEHVISTQTMEKLIEFLSKTTGQQFCQKFDENCKAGEKCDKCRSVHR